MSEGSEGRGIRRAQPHFYKGVRKGSGPKILELTSLEDYLMPGRLPGQEWEEGNVEELRDLRFLLQQKWLSQALEKAFGREDGDWHERGERIAKVFAFEAGSFHLMLVAAPISDSPSRKIAFVFAAPRGGKPKGSQSDFGPGEVEQIGSALRQIVWEIARVEPRMKLLLEKAPSFARRLRAQAEREVLEEGSPAASAPPRRPRCV